ncbi:MAG TPA: 5-(carboxyamino)imidazole ribonucleotide synthase [Ignavibacteria bacterium]|nr:5-(carboxyamino)imidazole ribonucleotide synthase [Ignavibacteria bacterium]HRF67557.1 5-(carboxyamino)imidazole ribonucleotide synthase [Ignavibacteria bacterium]HRJ05361.1 5-(carboxyamino)imidazole ribonucleotide synthase [Ignavibacteria bacterium]
MKKPICIGILGGGQLARMSAFAAIRMGFDIAVLEKEADSPAGMISSVEITGSPSNKKLLKKLAAVSDVITLENEFIDYRIIEYLESLGVKVFPSSATIAMIQDKLIQKQTLLKYNIPLPKFTAVNHKYEFEKTAEELKLPFVLKSRKMGYDGYGNAMVRNKKDFDTAFDKLTHRHSKLLAEEFVHFTKEIAVMAVRTKKESVVYPVVETIQKDHICHTVIAPAKVKESVRRKASKIAMDCVKAVKGFGLFGIEMFYTNDGRLLVNEMAPRPHNSGHYSIEGCITSQFENHIRAVLNLPLGNTAMVNSFAVMINLLGKTNKEGIVKNYAAALGDKDIHLHIYGKKNSRVGRKMGHVTVTGNDPGTILRTAKAAEKKIVI